MEYEISGGPLEGSPADALILAVTAEGRLSEAALRVDARLRGALAAACGSGANAFGGRPSDVREVHVSMDDRNVRVYLTALGEAGGLGAETVRRAAASAMRRAVAAGARAVCGEALGAGAGLPAALAAQATVEGVGLARDAIVREGGTGVPPDVARVFSLHGPVAGLPTGLRRGRILTEATVLARDLANAGGEDGQRRFHERVRRVFAGTPVQVGPEEAEHSGDPRFIMLRFRGARRPLEAEGAARPAPALAVVGAGSLARGAKGLAGPAAVAGAFAAIAEMRPPLDVDAFIAIGGQEPEEAWSRALRAARGSGAGRIVDVASLSDGALAALGREMAVIMSNDQELGEAVQRAGALAGERLWPLPVDPAYGESLEPGEAPAIAAGMAVGRIAETTPWCHLDVAAVAAGQRRPYHPLDPGVANGFGARTLALLAERMAPEP